MVTTGQYINERGEPPATADGVMRLARGFTDCPPSPVCVHGRIPGIPVTGDPPANQQAKRSRASGVHGPDVWITFKPRTSVGEPTYDR